MRKFLFLAAVISLGLTAAEPWTALELKAPAKNPGCLEKRTVEGKAAQVLISRGKEAQARIPSFALKNAQQAVIEYDFYPVSGNSRYMLLCSCPSGKKILVPVFNGRGEVSIANGRQSLMAGRIKLKAWNRIRYVIFPDTETVDLYLNDMAKPALRGIPFREKPASKRLMLYSLTMPQKSETAFADIRCRLLKSRSFPGEALAAAPYCFTGIKKISSQPGTADWASVPEIPLAVTGKTPEAVSFKMLADNEAFFLRFFCTGKPDLRKSGRDGRLWLKDCIELFLQPDTDSDLYYHLAGNASGERYDARCQGKKKDKNFNADWKIDVRLNKESWEATFILPYKSFGLRTPGEFTLWGLNAARENASNNTQASWSQTNSFHDIKRFGKGIFYTQLPAGKKLQQAHVTAGEKIFKQAPRLKELEKRISESSAGAPDIVRAAGGKLLQKTASAAKELAAARAYNDFFQLEQKIVVLENETANWQNMVKFYAAVFSGKKAGKSTVRILPGARKIVTEHYRGAGGSRAELFLAGGETAGFTVVLIPSPGKKIDQVSVSWGKLPGGVLPQNYRLREIFGAELGKLPAAYFDAMEPGEKFDFTAPFPLTVFYCELEMPRNFKEKSFETAVTLTTSAGEKLTVPVQVLHAGFDIPSRTTLDTAFCFVMDWTKKYYGRKLTLKEKQGFWRTIGVHRLEPMNLWGGRDADGMIDFCMDKCGKKMLFLRVNKLTEARELLQKYGKKLRPVFFGYDEILVHTTPEKIRQMREAYGKAKKEFPHVERLNTSPVDKRLFGAVDIWCPHFDDFRARAAADRKKHGEKVWWYLTGIPGLPMPNLNLDSPETAARVIPWMTWQVGASGLLYWAINREFPDNAPEALSAFTEREISLRHLNWMTPENIRLWQKKKVRWPGRPWLSFYRSINSGRTAADCGSGNLLYPGTDVTLWPSVRLKNLRDGLQDYEYLVLLKSILPRVKDAGLRREICSALNVSGKIAAFPRGYTKTMEDILAEKKHLARLINTVSKTERK